MNLLPVIKQAFHNLSTAKMRSFLATLGILVGTASVVTLVSSGESATAKALEQFKRLGTNLMSISMYEQGGSGTATPGNTLTINEAFAMKERFTFIKKVVPYTTTFVPIRYQNHTLEGITVGATEDMKETLKIGMEEGNFVYLLQDYQRYCVLGHKLFERIRAFYRGPVVGTQIWLGSQIYTIIGVTKPLPENGFFDADLNQSIFIPIKSSALLNPENRIRNLVVMLDPEAPIDTVQKSITQYIKQVAPELKTFIRSARQLIEGMKNQHQILTLLLGFIGGISLLVGGIGVMNVMLVSVAERKREIGIRKAIGATPKDIQILFLSESVLLALLGGIFGIIVGILAATLIDWFAKWPLHIFLIPPLIGFCVSAATGIFFGFYPARRAAKLNPIEALRQE